MKLGASQNQSARYMADRKEKLPVTGISMTADWSFLLGFFAVVFAGLLLWSWSMFRTVSETSYLKDTVQTSARTNVNEEQLDRVTKRFESRRDRFETLSGGFVFEGVQSGSGGEEFEIEAMGTSTFAESPTTATSSASSTSTVSTP
jgi:hypothetical protein